MHIYIFEKSRKGVTMLLKSNRQIAQEIEARSQKQAAIAMLMQEAIELEAQELQVRRDLMLEARSTTVHIMPEEIEELETHPVPIPEAAAKPEIVTIEVKPVATAAPKVAEPAGFMASINREAPGLPKFLNFLCLKHTDMRITRELREGSWVKLWDGDYLLTSKTQKREDQILYAWSSKGVVCYLPAEYLEGREIVRKECKGYEAAFFTLYDTSCGEVNHPISLDIKLQGDIIEDALQYNPYVFTEKGIWKKYSEYEPKEGWCFGLVVDEAVYMVEIKDNSDRRKITTIFLNVTKSEVPNKHAHFSY